MKEQAFPMIDPTLENIGLNMFEGGAKLVAAIPPPVWEVIFAYYLLKFTVSKLRNKPHA